VRGIPLFVVVVERGGREGGEGERPWKEERRD